MRILKTIAVSNSSSEGKSSRTSIENSGKAEIEEVSSLHKPEWSKTSINNLYKPYHSDFGCDVPGSCVGKDSFLNLEDVIAKLDTTKPIILNMGGSVTAGYQANSLYTGKKDISGLLFAYRTYSSFLEDDFSHNVINMGVPSFTSHQVRKKLTYVLSKLKAATKVPNFVSFYVGNNDSRHGREHKVSLDQKEPSYEGCKTKVTVEDFGVNIGAMIDEVRNSGAVPIIIRPLTNYFAEPLIATEKFKDDPINGINPNLDYKTKLQYQAAIEAYQAGDYRKANELDTKLSRMKDSYLAELNRICQQKKIPLIDLQDELSLDIHFS